MNVGFASTAPITWLQSEIAINPDTHIVITPSALNFGGSGAGSIHAKTRASILIIMVLAIGGSTLGWKWAIDPKRRNQSKFHPRTLHQGTMRRPTPMH